MSSSKAEPGSSGLDTVKLIAALAVLTVGVVAYYYFAEQSNLYRVLGMLAAAGIAIALFVTTSRGRALGGFLRASRTEVRKMVWPTRQEALQTTLIVMVVVFLVGIFLWLVDMLLAWGVKLLIGGG